MIEKFIDIPTPEEKLPTRQLLSEIYEALRKSGFDRVMTVQEFISTPPVERKNILKAVEESRGKLARFFLTTDTEERLIHHVFPDITVSDPLGKIITVSGPSGVGKDTLIQKFIEVNPRIDKIITATTRPKRVGEQEGVNYHYLSRDDFEFLHKTKLLVDRLDFIENSYGAPKSELRKRERGDVLLNAVPATAHIFKKIIPDTKSIIIVPPGITQEEKETEIKRRLQLRGTESEDTIIKRIAQDRVNFADWDHIADFTIVSETDNINGSLEQLENIIKSI